MARTADQIVTEQLGALHLQFVLAVARAEAAEEKVAELTARGHALEKELAVLKTPGVSKEDVKMGTLSEDLPV